MEYTSRGPRSRESAAKYDRPNAAVRYHARRYSGFSGRLNLWAMRRALRGALCRHVPAGGRVLDIPCGTGQYSWEVAAAGYRVVAADISVEMVRTAAELGRGSEAALPEFLVENIFELSFLPGVFDGAICIRLFNLLDRPDRVAALRELGRVARCVIVSYSHPYTLKQTSRVLRGWLGFGKERRPRLTGREVSDEVAESGLEIRQRIAVAPIFSEVWLVVLARGDVRR